MAEWGGKLRVICRLLKGKKKQLQTHLPKLRILTVKRETGVFLSQTADDTTNGNTPSKFDPSTDGPSLGATCLRNGDTSLGLVPKV